MRRLFVGAVSFRRCLVGTSVAVVLAAGAASCGDSPVAPTPVPIPTSPTMTCPATVETMASDAATVAVSFDAPAAVGGSQPVAVACTPGSGSEFPVGRTSVFCVATDAIHRTAVCEFDVVVRQPPRISVTSVLAFGDSITAGEVAETLSRQAFMPDKAYPAVLQKLLAARYAAQKFTVVNAGKGGEQAVSAPSRLREELSARQPQVLLLLEGVNDLAGQDQAAIMPAVDGVKAMIRSANDMGIPVFVGTLLPLRPGLQRSWAEPFVMPFNNELRDMVSRENATLVDLYAAVYPDLTRLIGSDGLHPTEEGNVRVAETFFAALKARFELPAPPEPAAPAPTVRRSGDPRR